VEIIEASAGLDHGNLWRHIPSNG